MSKSADRTEAPDNGTPDRQTGGYDQLLGSVTALLEAARRASAGAVNAVMTTAYWETGRRIVEFEQGGEERAEYGAAVIERLSRDLTVKFGRGFSPTNLSQMKKFYLLWPAERILQTASGELQASPMPSGPGAILQTTSEKSRTASAEFPLPAIAPRFPLSWSAYVRYAMKNWTRPGENPPVGLILCARKDEALARYALDNLPNKVLAAEYRTELPDEKLIAEELERTHRLLDARRFIPTSARPKRNRAPRASPPKSKARREAAQ